MSTLELHFLPCAFVSPSSFLTMHFLLAILSSGNSAVCIYGPWMYLHFWASDKHHAGLKDSFR